jgi:hypothetical protein
MGMLLCLTRGIAKYYMPQFYKQRTMQHVGTVRSAHHTELVGRTMGIVGMGGIGSALARRAHYGFDMRIVATDAKPIPKPDCGRTARSRLVHGNGAAGGRAGGRGAAHTPDRAHVQRAGVPQHEEDRVFSGNVPRKAL